MLSSLPHTTERYYLDMKEITKERAFDTMTFLSQTLGFQAPKEQDRELFERQVWANLYFILPFNLQIPLFDSKSLRLTFAQVGHKGENLTQILIPQSYQKNTNLENIQIYIENKKDIQIINENLKMIQAEIIKTLEVLLEIIATKQSHAVSEKDILEYLKSHPQVAKDLKEILDNDLQEIKHDRPDIVESWQYYQEFEVLCKISKG